MAWLVACATVSVVPLDGPGTDDAGQDSRTPAEAGPDTSVEAAMDSGAPDADADADAGPVILKRVSGHVDYGGPVINANVTVLSPTAMSTTTDQRVTSSSTFLWAAPSSSRSSPRTCSR